MSLLPRFPPHHKLRGRDYNLIADALQHFLIDTSPTDTTVTVPFTGSGVTSVNAGAGTAVSPTTGDVIVTGLSPAQSLPYGNRQGILINFSGGTGSWVNVTLTGTFLPEIKNDGAFTAAATNSIYTINVSLEVEFSPADSPLDTRLTLNGTELVKGTTQLTAQGGSGGYQGFIYTTTKFQLNDIVRVQLWVPAATTVFDNVGCNFNWIRWA